MFVTPKFCTSIVFSFSWGHFNSQEKLHEDNAYAKFRGDKKERYGMLWHFLEWSINECVSVMVFHLNFCPTLVFFLLADWSTLLLSYFSQFYDHVETLLWSCTTFYQGKNLTCSLAALDPALSFQKLILHCITATNKSLECLKIITVKNEAGNRVDSTVCVRYITGDNYV